MVLVPASMAVLGRYAWWAPGPLRRLHDRFGLRESAHPVTAKPEPVTDDHRPHDNDRQIFWSA
jgi:RND superfamily putative drug exporter